MKQAHDQYAAHAAQQKSNGKNNPSIENLHSFKGVLGGAPPNKRCLGDQTRCLLVHTRSIPLRGIADVRKNNSSSIPVAASAPGIKLHVLKALRVQDIFAVFQLSATFWRASSRLSASTVTVISSVSVMVTSYSFIVQAPFRCCTEWESPAGDKGCRSRPCRWAADGFSLRILRE